MVLVHMLLRASHYFYPENGEIWGFGRRRALSKTWCVRAGLRQSWEEAIFQKEKILRKDKHVFKPECSKFSQPGFNNTWTMNYHMFKLVLEKAEEPEIKLPTSAGSSKKQERSRKTSISALLTLPKPLTVWITKSCGKFWERCDYQTTWPASCETMQVRKQQLELYMEQQK